jgi:hypothetical protein
VCCWHKVRKIIVIVCIWRLYLVLMFRFVYEMFCVCCEVITSTTFNTVSRFRCVRLSLWYQVNRTSKFIGDPDCNICIYTDVCNNYRCISDISRCFLEVEYGTKCTQLMGKDCGIQYSVRKKIRLYPKFSFSNLILPSTS